MRERPGGQVGDDLLDDRVVTVLALGLDRLERGVGEDRVVPVGGEELALARGCFPFSTRTRRTMSRAVTCSLFFRDVNAVYPVSATSASETQHDSWSSQRACGYLTAVQASSPMRPIAALMLVFIGTVTEKYAPLRMAALITAEL
jgi:hypothetical protein